MRNYFFMYFFRQTLGFGIFTIIILPLVGPLLISLNNWLWTSSWGGWDVREAWRALKGGLIITPIAACVLTLAEYGRHRGWWR